MNRRGQHGGGKRIRRPGGVEKLSGKAKGQRSDNEKEWKVEAGGKE